MPVQRRFEGPAPVLVWTDDIEPAAIAQLKNVARLPFVHHHVAAMPDVHLGIGATVGSVIPTRGAIIPAAVGVDIGCGMEAVRLSVGAADLPDSLRGLRNAIEAAVPVGFGMHPEGHKPLPGRALRAMATGLDAIYGKHPALRGMQKGGSPPVWVRQLGTLGGGNHFIELCLDEADALWVMLHSGSRGIGNVIGRYFIALAKRDLGAALGRLPDKDLAYLNEGTSHCADYIEAVGWAQHYAAVNRRAMLDAVLAAIAPLLPPFQATSEAISCHHNYVARERHFGADVFLTRKGAIRARAGDLGIIPGSMGARSYIVRGKGNPDAFCSCSHGAGRRLSRGAAKAAFSLRDLAEQTAGVECRKDAGVLDECPAAYKDIDAVMAAQSDLVEVVHQLRQVLCVKG